MLKCYSTILVCHFVGKIQCPYCSNILVVTQEKHVQLISQNQSFILSKYISVEAVQNKQVFRVVNVNNLVVISSFSTFFISPTSYKHVLSHFKHLGLHRLRQKSHFAQTKTPNSKLFFRIQFSSSNFQKIITPSLLTRFDPRFRPQFRLGKYFLNLWTKNNQKILSFPRFSKMDSRYILSA